MQSFDLECSAADVFRRMNEYGANAQPFLFGVDYELQRGFFVEQPFQCESLWWRIGTRGNFNRIKQTPPSGSYFRPHPIAESEYRRRFDLAKQQLDYGNSFLLNLTVETPLDTDYSGREIFTRSHSQYALYVPRRMVCFSPETFVKISGQRISTFPMKGTIAADLPDAQHQILHDYKESAEHFTIVDLMRSDLSRVATDIRVERLRYLDRLETSNGAILQVSSEVTGQLPRLWQSHLGDLMQTLLPAGSISGAPKPATRKIIRSAEPLERGYYTGVFGLFDGVDFDSSVMIRFIERADDDRILFRSGGGITVNSDPHSEYEEVVTKVYLPF